MLDFLVLGIIPGTSITLTITWVLLIGLAISLGTLGFLQRKKLQSFKETHIERLKLTGKIIHTEG